MLKVIDDSKNYKFYLQIDKITRQTKRGIRQAFYQIGRGLKSHANQKMQEPKSGRIYYVKRSYSTKSSRTQFRPGRSAIIRHQASAPGEFPWSRAPQTTGNLRSSLNFAVHGAEQLEFGANTPYAQYLELGSDLNGGGRMLPRPYLKQSIIDTQAQAIEFFNAEIKRALEHG